MCTVLAKRNQMCVDEASTPGLHVFFLGRPLASRLRAWSWGPLGCRARRTVCYTRGAFCFDEVLGLTTAEEGEKMSNGGCVLEHSCLEHTFESGLTACGDKTFFDTTHSIRPNNSAASHSSKLWSNSRLRPSASSSAAAAAKRRGADPRNFRRSFRRSMSLCAAF